MILAWFIPARRPDLSTLVLNRLRQTAIWKQASVPLSSSQLARHQGMVNEVRARCVFRVATQFPRLTEPDAIETRFRAELPMVCWLTSARPANDYKPFHFNQALMTADVEFSEEMFIVTKETAECLRRRRGGPGTKSESQTRAESYFSSAYPGADGGEKKPVEPKKPEQLSFTGMTWSGDVPPQKWMNFYTKVLSKFASGRGLKLNLNVEVKPDGGISKQKVEETKAALRELGLSDNITSD